MGPLTEPDAAVEEQPKPRREAEKKEKPKAEMRGRRVCFERFGRVG